METIYIKQGKRYINIGLLSQHDILYDGLWLVQSETGIKSHSNLCIRLSDLPQPTDVQEYLKAFLNKEAIIKAFEKINKKGKIYLCDISLNDAVDMLIGEIFEESRND